MDLGILRLGCARRSFVRQTTRCFACSSLVLFLITWLSASSSATVTSITIQTPALTTQNIVDVTSPMHFEATSESSSVITGYVVYVDHENVYQNHSASLDAWIALAPGTTHSIYVTAWDSNGGLLSTPTYSINVTAAALPIPPATAIRKSRVDSGSWTVDNNAGVGGECNDGSIGAYSNSFDPNTANSPGSAISGQHFVVTSKCKYDDSLFYRKDSTLPSPYAGDTNFLWDFWMYVPTTTPTSAVQAIEADLFQAVQMSDGVHEFMFGSQCDYATNQWQFWLPQSGKLTWANVNLSPCQFTPGSWHHLTYFLQRVTATGYQVIPATFGPTSDPNTYLRFGTLTVDGTTMFVGGLANSTVPSPAWAPVVGIQHQLDSAESNVKLEEYVNKESVTSW